MSFNAENEKTPRRKLQKICNYFVRTNSCEFTEIDLFNYFIDSSEYLLVYNNWKDSKFSTIKSPSIFCSDLYVGKNIKLVYLSIKSKSECLKQIKEKKKVTNLKRYGVEHVLQAKSVKNKSKKTCLKKYGNEYITKTKEWKSKVKQTLLNKYNVTSPNQIPDVRDRIKKTTLARYGTEHPLQNPTILNKQQTTMFTKFGKKNASNVPELKKKAVESMLKTKKLTGSFKVFDSGESIKDISKQLGYSYSYCIQLLKTLDLPDLKQILNSRGKKPTALELTVSKLLNLEPLSYTYIKGQMPDFKLTDKIYLDIDGLFYHSDRIQKDPKYHFNKRINYENNGLRLLQFRENEILKQTNIVKSMIDSIVGSKSTTTIYARDCILKEISKEDAKLFCNNNHLQGYSKSIISFGLFYKNELVQVLVLGKSHTVKKSEIYLERFCSKNCIRVVGGFSKLLKVAKNYAKKEGYLKLISFCDLRYSQGQVYEKNGFIQVSEQVSWCWTNYKDTFHRLKVYKLKDGYEKGLSRIFDAGQRKYELSLL